MPLVRTEFTDDALRALLTGDADPKHTLRQKAATDADAAKTAHPGGSWSAFMPNSHTYFVETNAAEKRYTMVLGWNHAVLIRKTGGVYRPVKVYRWKDEGFTFGSIADLPMLVDDGADVVWGGQRWRGATPPVVALERVITYGVSSCSFSVLSSTPDAEYIAVSHLSGEPMIPVADMMPDGVAGTWLLASVLPQELELAKFESNRRLTAGRLLLRGRAPNFDGDDARFHPPMGHADIGLEFPEGRATLIGTIGMEQNHNYSRLIPKPALGRLKSFADDALDDDVIFVTATTEHARGVAALRPLYEDKGHPLSIGARLTVAGDEGQWTLEDTRGGRNVAGTIVTKPRPHEWEGRAFDVTLSFAGGAPTSRTVRLKDETVILYLDQKSAVQVSQALSDQGYRFDADPTVVVGRAGSSWTVTGEISGRAAKITIAKGATCIIRETTPEFQHKSTTERVDIVAEVVNKLLGGDYGFAALHNAVFEAVISLYRTRRSARSSWTIRQSKMDKWESANVDASYARIDAAKRVTFALLLGYYAAHEAAEHEYTAAIGPIVKLYRYRMAIPWSTGRG